MGLVELANAIAPQLEAQGRLIRLPEDRPVVFVGDTHGDLEATQRVLSRHAPAEETIIFLGDAVDRGPDSAENLGLILETVRSHPTSVHLLMGNHEVWRLAPFSPADFWEGLESGEGDAVAAALELLPYAAWHPAGVLALHGAFPDVADLTSIESIELGSEAWRAITWGDWGDRPSPVTSSGRPMFGRREFVDRARQLGVRVLVRSHQPHAPISQFDDRCLTIFTSSAYGPGPRRVALLPAGRRVETTRSLDLEAID